MATIHAKSKLNFKFASEKIGPAYIRKFESVVKQFENFMEEEKIKQIMDLRSRLAGMN